MEQWNMNYEHEQGNKCDRRMLTTESFIITPCIFDIMSECMNSTGNRNNTAKRGGDWEKNPEKKQKFSSRGTRINGLTDETV